jgi:hypothetical protein
MTIFVKNKHTLQIDEFKFRCYQDKCKALKKLGESCNEENGSDFIKHNFHHLLHNHIHYFHK